MLLLVIALQIPAVQQFTAQKATNYLAQTLKTKVSIGRFTTDWRNSIVLKEIYLEDQKQDTLVYAEECGWDAVGCNEHHFSPYGLMSNCNIIGAIKTAKYLGLGADDNVVTIATDSYDRYPSVSQSLVERNGGLPDDDQLE